MPKRNVSVGFDWSAPETIAVRHSTGTANKPADSIVGTIADALAHEPCKICLYHKVQPRLPRYKFGNPK